MRNTVNHFCSVVVNIWRLPLFLPLLPFSLNFVYHPCVLFMLNVCDRRQLFFYERKYVCTLNECVPQQCGKQTIILIHQLVYLNLFVALRCCNTAQSTHRYIYTSIFSIIDYMTYWDSKAYHSIVVWWNRYPIWKWIFKRGAYLAFKMG